jgi:molybdopterin-synthase adenylyltransferase
MNNPSRYAQLKRLPWWDAGAVARAGALVAGAGALGNEVLKNLLLLGWGRIAIVDFDFVEESNLSRSILFQAEDIGLKKVAAITQRSIKVNPDCRVVALDGDLRLQISVGMVGQVDVVFGCVDNISARLALNRLARTAGRPWIDGGLSAWEGTVTLYCDEEGPCYACGLTEDDFKDLNQRHACPAYAARARAASGVPTTPTTSSIVGASMVQMGLKWIHGRRAAKDIPRSGQLRFDTAYDRFWKLALPKNPDCYLHPETLIPDQVIRLPYTDSWGDIFKSLYSLFGSSEISIKLAPPVVRSYRCPACGRADDRPRTHLADQPFPCPACQTEVIPNFVNAIDSPAGWEQLTPLACGFPPGHWLTARSVTGAETTIELTGPSLFG